MPSLASCALQQAPGITRRRYREADEAEDGFALVAAGGDVVTGIRKFKSQGARHRVHSTRGQWQCHAITPRASRKSYPSPIHFGKVARS